MTRDLLERIRVSGAFYDPTLAVWEAQAALVAGRTELLGGSLVQQTVAGMVLRPTRTMVAKRAAAGDDQAAGIHRLADLAARNLRNAYEAGVNLVAGSDAGNFLVFHGPGLHRELQLWVAAGIPASVALQAATWNAARLLRADARLGLVAPGHDADLLIVDGNPLDDISVTERISLVVFKGERLRRAALLSNGESADP
jgi:imidazolonepropionase-like amidohydrolase